MRDTSSSISLCTRVTRKHEMNMCASATRRGVALTNYHASPVGALILPLRGVFREAKDYSYPRGGGVIEASSPYSRSVEVRENKRVKAQ